METLAWKTSAGMLITLDDMLGVYRVTVVSDVGSPAIVEEFRDRAEAIAAFETIFNVLTA